ncbi:MAG TPA: circularly permuted type 2 ATP-grasp protein [Verrucomicrobiae bacterium]|nr:circularly permuted type 2 ATP-grasp protein [Verrucomicrobiae bacterium]
MSDEATTESPARTDSLFRGYAPGLGGFDEMAAGPGRPREHWRELVSSLDRLGAEELNQRGENARRTLREHGVTYNVYADPQGIDRPWELDLVPLLIPPAEWRHIEEGLKQRARLFNQVLTDLYGPQRLLRDGVLPPALVFANPGFLRPCHGVPVPRDLHLHLHAADLARSPDGQWWVLADRTQAPSGAGYALENRIVLSRVLPDQFRDCHVERLASFFSLLRDNLQTLAPPARTNPNVVLLTPGPYNETYFEHVYLARYLGFTLVEGGDLTVRNRRVYIKTLEGLQPVDVILRRVDDTFCDPLELRNDSFLGVPGLVEAARAGHVTVANALGAGLVESPAFLAFLPGLCRHLLGEELILPSVATWWCGQAKEHQYVLDHLDKIVVKPAFGGPRRSPYFGKKMDSGERRQLIESICSRPHNYVGQEQVPLATAPVWLNGRTESRRVVLRAYVAAAQDDFAVMPGGLTRVSTAAEDPIVSMQSGGGSKDTWVLSDGPVKVVSLLSASGQPLGVARASGELPSRVADNLFWLGRYTERLEGMLRLLRSVIVRMADEAGGEGAPELAALVQILANLGHLPARFHGRVPVKDFEQEVLQLVYHPQRIGTVRELMTRIRHIAAIVRDRFSLDTWRIINQFQSDSRSRPGRIPLANALALLNTLIVDLAAFSGMEMENMTRGHGWRFLDFGRRLERSVNLVKLLRAGTGLDPYRAALGPLLEVADSTLTYRRRYFAQPQLASVLELLLFDAGNPRAFAFQLQAMMEHAENMPRDTGGPEVEEEHPITALLARLPAVDLQAVCQAREEGEGEALDEWLGRFLKEMGAVSEALGHRYFSHTVARAS